MSKATFELVSEIYYQIKKSGKNPTIRLIAEMISLQHGYKPSFSTISTHLKGIPDYSTSPSESVSEPYPSLTSEKEALVTSETSKYKTLLELEKAKSEHYQLMYQQVKDEMFFLQEDYATNFSKIIQDFMLILNKTREDFKEELLKIRAERDSANEQWKGLKEFLYKETDKIRTQESSKVQLLQKHLDDAETRLYNMEMMKNSLLEKYSYLKGKYEPILSPEDPDKDEFN